MDPEAVATGALDRARHHVVLGGRRQQPGQLRGHAHVPREQITSFMSQGSTFLYDLPPLT